MSNATNPRERHPSNRRNSDHRRRNDVNATETPSPHRADGEVIALPSTPPSVAPGLVHVAHLVDHQAQKLHAYCEQLEELMETLDQDIDPDVPINETFDPEAARRLWQHVPDLIDLTFGVSNLAFWTHILRTVLDIERRHGTIR